MVRARHKVGWGGPKIVQASYKVVRAAIILFPNTYVRWRAAK